MSDANLADAAVIDLCNRAIGLFEKQYGTDDAMTDGFAEGWSITNEVMTADITTLVGARAQLALLACLWEGRGGPEKPEVDWPPIENLLSLLPAA